MGGTRVPGLLIRMEYLGRGRVSPVARARAFGSRRRDHPVRLGHYSRRVATLLHDAIAVLGAQRRGQTVDKSTRSGERRTTRQGAQPGIRPMQAPTTTPVRPQTGSW